MAVQNPTVAIAVDTGSSKSVPWYISGDDLPDLDEPVRKLFAQYSRLPAEKVRSHVLKEVRSHLPLFDCMLRDVL